MYIKNRLGLIESVETLLAQERRMNQVSNNLANVDTNGFKKENVTFWEMLYTASDQRQRVGKAMKVITDYAQGTMELTGNPLDLAINGKGFFKVMTPLGIRYTRAGNFFRNDQSQLVTPDGHLVMGQGGEITIQGDEVGIDRYGRISVDGEEMGQLSVVTFTDPDVLQKEGENNFRLVDERAQELTPEFLQVRQGYLEASNVSTVVEMTAMIDLHRAYEAQQKSVHAIDSLDDKAVNSVGKLT
ncbi:MAG: flagellar basal-body rod protein FlgF [Thermodesulfobacteriota bacterium]|nr:flagellar basal-body rod protein FlgF [Thermodesulfobacteriota bacterium]